MNNEINPQEKSVFEQIRHTNEAGHDYWSSRDLARVLNYTDYRNFELVVHKAELACFNSGQRVDDHFVDITEMIYIGKGGKRTVKSILLSRYACYLVIQNADPSKKIVAAGQMYFAVQTRRQELADQSTENERRLLLRREVKEHNLKLAGTAKTAGVVNAVDYAIFQNHGYIGLYGGLTAQDIHRRKKLSKNQQILDHMGSSELAANLFRTTQTEEKIRREKIAGKESANKTHLEVGKKVRETIRELGGTLPENLPVVEDVKRLMRRNAKFLKNK